MRIRIVSVVFGGAVALATTAYVGVTTGAVALDLGVGRRRRQLGPLRLRIAAPPETVFDVIASPYLGRTPRAMEQKLRVIGRGDDYALAAHFTRVNRVLTAKTVELVQFSRPEQITFRLLRGPASDGFETFALRPVDGETEFEYTGFLEADLWGLGAWWVDRVAQHWERAVADTLDSVCAEAERRTAR